jgi:hypothetical protein
VKPGGRGPALLERIDQLSRELVELRIEVAHELGLDGDDEIAQLAAEDLRRAARRGGRR